MTIKKLTIIAAAGAVLLAGAMGISMQLTGRDEIEMEVPESPVTQELEDGSKMLENMENIPLYYDETKQLLLPLRNVMEGLGGTVEWNPETRKTEVTYRGRVLSLTAGEKQAVLNGCEVTLPEAAEIINGCLYADAELISAYYTGEVVFNHETRQVTLYAKDQNVPVVAVNQISGERDGKTYAIDVPVILGLNDSNYEKNLNESLKKEMLHYADMFMATQQEEGGLTLEVKAGLCHKDFLSIQWAGEKDGAPVFFGKNIDLIGQKTVALSDMIDGASWEAVKGAVGEEPAEDGFCLTENGELMLFVVNEEETAEQFIWNKADGVINWKEPYRGLFRK